MPALTDLDASHPDIDYRAALQAMAMIHTQFNDGNGALREAMLRLDPFVVFGPSQEEYPNWSTEPDGIPRYASWRLTTGSVWVVISGTYTSYQWVQNVAGVILEARATPCTQLGQGHWLSMATQIGTALEASPLSDPLAPINIVGHSLGGAVAWYLANKLRDRLSFGRKNVLTFGSPRTTDAAPCDATTPLNFEGNVQTLGDIVVALPPSFLLAPWVQNGQINVIRNDGTLADDDANAGTVTSGAWNSSRFSQHFPRTYYDALKARYDAGDPDETTRRILVALGYQEGLPEDSQVPSVKPPVLPPLPEIPAGWSDPLIRPIAGG
jgi:pimeloyl-ACP methyl ester carboxylesterase